MFDCQGLAVQAIHKNREVLLASLQALSIGKVVAQYSGGGDSGDVCELHVIPEFAAPGLQATEVTETYVHRDYTGPETGWQFSLRTRVVPLEEALHDFTLDWLEIHHPGWENDDGGDGSMSINVAAGTCRLEHREFYTESTGYEYEL